MFPILWPRVAQAEDHRVCIRWDWLGKQAGFRDISPRPAKVGLGGQTDWDTYNYAQDAQDDRGRRDQPDDLAPRRMLARVTNGSSTLWGWDFLDEHGCTDVFDTAVSTVDLEFVRWSYWESTGNQVVVLNCLDGDCFVDPDEVTLSVSSGVQDVLYSDANSGIGYQYAVHWAMSFAEEDVPLHTGLTKYGALWGNGAIPRSQTNLLIGGQPTVSILSPSDQAKRKYVIVHEFGHLQTLVPALPAVLNFADLDYCFDPGQLPNEIHCSEPSQMLTANHGFDSQEWQSAAAVEGFADFYSMLVFNDPGGGLGVIANNQALGSIVLLPPEEILAYRSDESNASWYLNLDPSVQVQGTAIQHDWAFFAWDMVIGANAIDPADVLAWLWQSYPWPLSGVSDDWWSHFHATNAAPLDATQEAKFDDAAASRKVDQ